jgi:hypothetical protein
MRHHPIAVDALSWYLSEEAIHREGPLVGIELTRSPGSRTDVIAPEQTLAQRTMNDSSAPNAGQSMTFWRFSKADINIGDLGI